MSRSYTTLDFSEEELDGALDFIDASLNFYQNESYRRAELHRLQALGDLISPEINLEPKLIKPDGTLTVIEPISKQEAYVRIVEMKNEIGEGGSDPITQAECGFVLVCSSKKVTVLPTTMAYTQLPLCSTNCSEAYHVARCFLLGSPVRILPSLGLSLRRDSSRNA